MSSAKWHPYSLCLNVFRNARHRKFSVSVPMIVQIWKYSRNSSKIPALKIPPEKKVVYATHRRFPFRYVISLYWFWVRHYKAVGALLARSRLLSKSQDRGLYFSDRSEIRQPFWQQQCQKACQLSKPNKDSNKRFRSIEIQSDRTKPAQASLLVKRCLGPWPCQWYRRLHYTAQWPDSVLNY